MKKLLPFLFLILSLSIITEQYFYFQNCKLVNTELSSSDIPTQNTEDQSDCNEFVTLQSEFPKIIDIQRSQLKTHNIGFFIQEYSHQIWQPPKVNC